MSANFVRLPRELRDAIYELCLVQDEPINTCLSHGQCEQLGLGLLHSNRIIRSETCPVYYSQNCFDFTMVGAEGITSFLEAIGDSNAEYIQHIHVCFPYLRCEDSGIFNVDEDSIGIFTIIQSSFANLKTLTTSSNSFDVVQDQLKSADNIEHMDVALTLVDNLFRASSSLKEVIVEMYKDEENDHVKGKMQRLGWKMRAMEHWDAWGNNSLGDGGFDDRSIENDYESLNDDEYDIDNDSDYWRRAGD